MKIVNSLTNKKEEFVPIHDGEVNVYACGPTVYNYFHIGNARPFIVFDTLRRYLEFRGYKVNYVQNFTDVDDKMIREADSEHTTVKELGDKYIAEYFKDADALNIMRATHHPRATEHIPQIISLIQKLIDNGHAYVSGGDVYFDVKSFKDYGKLSGQSLEDLEAGARVDINEQKRDPMDFALWKAKKDGEPYWESPWGAGRPGWHIECSAMSMEYLGDTIDLHGGGEDLKFPHHENEIAQSQCATGKPFANYWMHNGYINIDNKKMSKSAGNFFTVRDILKEFSGPVIRLFMLDSHYASPINFSADLLRQSEKAYARIQNCRQNLRYAIEHPNSEQAYPDEAIKTLAADFNTAMDDDLNTAGAIGSIFEYIKSINTIFETARDKTAAEKALKALDERLNVLGLLKDEDDIPDDVKNLVSERQMARQNKDWVAADSIRDKLKALGYEVKDTADGAKISKI